MQKHPGLPQAFADLGIDVPLLKALSRIQFVEPSDIQKALIPPALEGRDILGQARTGTGKTAAFSLPVLQQIDPKERLQAVCLVPTRELAVQVAAEVQRLAYCSDIHVVAVYGGQKVATQAHQLGRKPHFVVGTPGRIMDFMQRRVLDLSNIRFAILDEVDRMLDIGFRDDIRNILGRITAPHQTIFVSATINEEIRRLALRYMREPLEINVSQDKLTVDESEQSYVTVENHDKFRLLHLILTQENPPVAIVFCNTKHAARKLAKKLHDAGVAAKEIHGDLEQRQRDKVMSRFRKHQIKVLVATDLASRGIDVSDISHIINYDIPDDSDVYVHRVGRTARMGAKGVAITFVNREQGKELTNIEKLINREVPQRHVEGFTPSQVPSRFGDRPMAPTNHQPSPPVGARPQPAPGQSAPRPTIEPRDTSAEPAVKPRPKTLGGRFKPARRSRRL